MYKTIEYFTSKEKTTNLKEVLKSCIYNYYKNKSNELGSTHYE